MKTIVHDGGYAASRRESVSPSEPAIRHISDTARWAAVYRARENERQDALFRDPFARRLAGKRGEEIAASLPFHEKNSWSWVTRTYLFDQFITESLNGGVEMVVNLAAGLDARPYRMALPSSLTWVEVDLPGILDYKEEILATEKPACALERVRLDLTDAHARLKLFDRLGGAAAKALIITEGLIIYLSAGEAGTLAEDIARQRTFQRWVLDIASPGLLRMLLKNTQTQFSQDVAPLKFAPEDGPEFFARHGWRAVDVRPLLKTAARLKRVSLGMRLLSLLPENPARMGSRPWSGVCLFTRQ
jgi:methyltransferase (TIGR00027 family)